MGAGHGIGIKRNSYHRRNRKANISMHSHSHGINVGDMGTDVPEYERPELIRAASAEAGDRFASIEQVCVAFLFKRAHSHSPLAVLQAIGYTYPWLSAECDRQYIERRRQVRVIKRAMTGGLTERQVYELNEPPRVEPDEPFSDTDYSAALCSLKFQATIYCPPFLKRDEIKARRFSDRYGEMNDRWWEWEREKRAMDKKTDFVWK